MYNYLSTQVIDKLHIQFYISFEQEEYFIGVRICE